VKEKFPEVGPPELYSLVIFTYKNENTSHMVTVSSLLCVGVVEIVAVTLVRTRVDHILFVVG
jgi:hypothetical protein